jgi:transposase-like protein
METERKKKAENHQGSLTFCQYRAIALTLSGYPDKEVCAKLGISSQTLARWWRKPGFRARYEERGDALLDSAMKYAQQKLKAVVDVLHEELSGEKPADRIRAATALAGVLFKAYEVTVGVELALKIDAMKEQLKSMFKGGAGFHDSDEDAPEVRPADPAAGKLHVATRTPGTEAGSGEAADRPHGFLRD